MLALDISEEIGRLTDRLRELEDRVSELEGPRDACLPSAIGYEIGEGEEFDEDGSEYVRGC